MKMVINTRKLQWHYFVSTTATTSGLILLIASLVTTLLLHPDVSVLPLLSIGILFFALGIRENNQWLRKPLAHETLNTALRNLNRSAIFYHYGPYANHILLCTQGVFTFTLLSQQTSLICKGGELHAQANPLAQSWQYILGNHPGRPVQAATADAHRLQTYLHQHLPTDTITVTPIIILSNPTAHIVNPEALPITYAFADKQKPSLRTLIRQRAASLTENQVITIDALLDPQGSNV